MSLLVPMMIVKFKTPSRFSSLAMTTHSKWPEIEVHDQKKNSVKMKNLRVKRGNVDNGTKMSAYHS